MDIVKSRYYNVNVTLLSLIGQWPYQNKMDRKILRIVIHIIIIGMIIAESANIFETWSAWDMTIETIVPMGVQITALFKSFNCILNEGKMKKLLNSIKENWSAIDNVEEMKIMKAYSERGRNITVLYSVWIFGSAFLYTLMPLVPRMLNYIKPLENGTRPVKYLFQTEYYIDREKYAYVLSVHSYMCMIVVMITIVSADTMYAAFIEHGCGLFAVVGYRLEKLGTGIKDDFVMNGSKEDDVPYHELVYCIRKHFQAIEFACLMESSYSTAWLCQVGICMLMLSITGIQVLITFGQLEEMVRFVQFIFAQLSHLFFNSLPGQRLLDTTTNFRESIYSGKWYSLSFRTRKLLRITMMRALKPHKITAGKLYDMSMENFGMVVQTSVSYFTVFASFR